MHCLEGAEGVWGSLTAPCLTSLRWDIRSFQVNKHNHPQLPYGGFLEVVQRQSS